MSVVQSDSTNEDSSVLFQQLCNSVDLSIVVWCYCYWWHGFSVEMLCAAVGQGGSVLFDNESSRFIWGCEQMLRIKVSCGAMQWLHFPPPFPTLHFCSITPFLFLTSSHLLPPPSLLCLLSQYSKICNKRPSTGSIRFDTLVGFNTRCCVWLLTLHFSARLLNESQRYKMLTNVKRETIIRK